MALVYTLGGNATAYTDGETSTGYGPNDNAYGSRITFASAGTINLLGVYGRITGGGSLTLKTALYTTAGVLVTGTSTSMTVSSATSVWNDSATFTPVAVSATEYIQLWSASTTNFLFGYDTATTGGVSPLLPYASFPESTLSNAFEDNEPNSGFGGRADFTAAGGGATDNVSVILQNYRNMRVI